MLNEILFKMDIDAVSINDLALVEQSDRFCHCLAFLDRKKIWIKYICSTSSFWKMRFLNEQSFYKNHASSLREFIQIPHCFKNKHGEYIIIECVDGIVISKERFSTSIKLERNEIEKLHSALNHLSNFKKDEIDIVFDKGYLLAQIEKAKMAEIVNTDQLDRIETQVKSTKFPLAVCHGDFLLKNIIKNKDQFYLIDWEYFGISVRFWDYATLWIQFIGKIDFQKNILNLIPSESVEEFKLTVISILLKELRLDFNTLERKNAELLKLELDNLINDGFSIG